MNPPTTTQLETRETDNHEITVQLAMAEEHPPLKGDRVLEPVSMLGCTAKGIKIAKQLTCK